MEKIVIYGVCASGGDGSAYPQWFLSMEKLKFVYGESCGGMGELCDFNVETYVGSNIHKEAIENEKIDEPDECY